MKRTHEARVLTLAVLLLAVRGAAQDPTMPSPAPTPAAPGAPLDKQPPKAVRATDFTLGLGYHGPTRLTGSATLMWGAARMFGALAPGKLVQVRAGARGGQVGLGLVGGAFEDSAFRPSGVGATLKAILLKTWRDPNDLRNGNVYAGVESDVVLLGFRGSAGYAWKVGGSGERGGRFVWSLGLGL